MKISDEKMVSLTYDLMVEEELMERATKEHPLTFVFGMGMMLEAFEKNVEGLKTNDKFSFTLTPEEAYGEYIEENVVELPKKIFEIDGVFDEEKISEGQTLPMMDASGHRMMGSVLEVKPDVVIMDFNHPLAGEILHFKGEVIDIHEPTAEEIARLSDDGGCGCDCDHCDSDGGSDGCGEGCC
ncbi:MAG: FKBP-type peptidyl-prolyl cis-trans isomerase [Dysgonamonadaceae bacterium]|jgi:FKBP-type peptidyl-prolyl cis-trans isomerase SlyD|nr:FKBP-type peptidyl-prolyl cis-trans isomerase [Dysgonamonadaceae bacterium]